MSTLLFAPDKLAALRKQLGYIEKRLGRTWLANQETLRATKLKNMATGSDTKAHLDKPYNHMPYFSIGKFVLWALSVGLIAIGFYAVTGSKPGSSLLVGAVAGILIQLAWTVVVRKLRLRKKTRAILRALDYYDLVFVPSSLLQRWGAVAEECGLSQAEAQNDAFLNEERMAFNELLPLTHLLSCKKLNDKLRSETEAEITHALQELAHKRLAQVGRELVERVELSIAQHNTVNQFAAALLDARRPSPVR